MQKFIKIKKKEDREMKTKTSTDNAESYQDKETLNSKYKRAK
jgi:hypothetical protein